MSPTINHTCVYKCILPHQVLRFSLGAFRTSPVDVLYAEANECSLQNRRAKLVCSMQPKYCRYTLQILLRRSFQSGIPCENFYKKQPIKIQPFGIRINSFINLDEIAPVEILKKSSTKFSVTPCSCVRTFSKRSLNFIKWVTFWTRLEHCYHSFLQFFTVWG